MPSCWESSWCGACCSPSACPSLTALFLITTILTTVTGFFNRRWRWIYVVAALLALYLNVFVLVVQGFQKVPLLNVLAPNGNEPAFIVAQTLVLLLFAWLGYLAVRRFHPEPVR